MVIGSRNYIILEHYYEGYYRKKVKTYFLKSAADTF